MKYLVVTIECILFLIFIAYLAFGIFLSFIIENNLPVLIGTATFFISLFIASCYIAYRSVKATWNMFKANNDNPIVFCSKIIKKDKGFRKLFVLALVNLAATLFWLIFVSMFVYFLIMFDTSDGDWIGNTNNLPITLAMVFPPYLAFLLGAYLTFQQIIKTLLQNNIKPFWNPISKFALSIQGLLLLLLLLFVSSF